MSTSKKFLHFVLILVLSVAAIFALSACGSDEEELHVSEGAFFEMGDIEYRVVFTRLLNIYDVEDVDYLTGQDPPPSGSSYLGVFVQLANESDEDSVSVPDEMWIEDSMGDEFEPIETESIFALEFGAEIPPEGQVPPLDSAAQSGPVKGSLIPFLIPDDSFENRPFELVIPGDDEDARVTLDL